MYVRYWGPQTPTSVHGICKRRRPTCNSCHRRENLLAVTILSCASQVLNMRRLKSSTPAATINWHLSQIRSEDGRSKMQLSPRGPQPSGQGYKVGTNPWCAVRKCTDKCQDWPCSCHEHRIHEHTNLLSLKKKKKINNLKLTPCFICLYC